MGGEMGLRSVPATGDVQQKIQLLADYLDILNNAVNKGTPLYNALRIAV